MYYLLMFVLPDYFQHILDIQMKLNVKNARQLGPNGEHELYDLKRCFSIGWQAGFRGDCLACFSSLGRPEVFMVDRDGHNGFAGD